MPTWTYPVVRGPDGHPIVVQYHDGDTVRLLLDLGLEHGGFPWLRVAGVNCPELRADNGPEAAEFLRSLLAQARDVDVHVIGRSFARWVADITVDGADLADTIIAAGHGVAHNG